MKFGYSPGQIRSVLELHREEVQLQTYVGGGQAAALVEEPLVVQPVPCFSSTLIDEKVKAMMAKTFLPSYLLVSRRLSSVTSQTLKVGDVLRETRVFSSEDVKAYAEVSHDWNPLHFDPESARQAGFENRLVHGMLVSSMFPRIISAHFPGAVYVSQTLHFRSPVYIGDEILGLVKATAFRETKNKYIVKFTTKCTKKHNELVVIDGEATAILPNLDMLLPSHSE